VQAQRWHIEILPYYTTKGAICKATEPYEMVAYQFIRYVPFTAKDNITQQADLFTKHYQYIGEISKNGNVVTQGTFGETDGGIFILKIPLEPEIIAKDPAVSNGLLETDIKKLWIAKGSFCEP
jgi:uncharacterized protein YciI